MGSSYTERKVNKDALNRSRYDIVPVLQVKVGWTNCLKCSDLQLPGNQFGSDIKNVAGFQYQQFIHDTRYPDNPTKVSSLSRVRGLELKATQAIKKVMDTFGTIIITIFIT